MFLSIYGQPIINLIVNHTIQDDIYQKARNRCVQKFSSVLQEMRNGIDDNFFFKHLARKALRFVFIINGRIHYSMFNVRCSMFDVHLLHALKVWIPH